MEQFTQSGCNRTRMPISDYFAIDTCHRHHKRGCCGHERFLGLEGLGQTKRPFVKRQPLFLDKIKNDCAGDPAQDAIFGRTRDQCTFFRDDPGICRTAFRHISIRIYVPGFLAAVFFCVLLRQNIRQERDSLDIDPRPAIFRIADDGDSLVGFAVTTIDGATSSAGKK
jgi:hypothetical protein